MTPLLSQRVRQSTSVPAACQVHTGGMPFPQGQVIMPLFEELQSAPKQSSKLRRGIAINVQYQGLHRFSHGVVIWKRFGVYDTRDGLATACSNT